MSAVRGAKSQFLLSQSSHNMIRGTFRWRAHRKLHENIFPAFDIRPYTHLLFFGGENRRIKSCCDNENRLSSCRKGNDVLVCVISITFMCVESTSQLPDIRKVLTFSANVFTYRLFPYFWCSDWNFLRTDLFLCFRFCAFGWYKLRNFPMFFDWVPFLENNFRTLDSKRSNFEPRSKILQFMDLNIFAFYSDLIHVCVDSDYRKSFCLENLSRLRKISFADFTMMLLVINLLIKPLAGSIRRLLNWTHHHKHCNFIRYKQNCWIASDGQTPAL